MYEHIFTADVSRYLYTMQVSGVDVACREEIPFSKLYEFTLIIEGVIDAFGDDVRDIVIHKIQYSKKSVNGVVRFNDGSNFSFSSEDGEVYTD